MFDIRLSIDSPWLPDLSKIFFCFEGMVPLCKNTGYTFQLSFWGRGGGHLIGAAVRCDIKGHDHAERGFEIDLLGFHLNAKLYDTRHWNWDANRWYLPGEESWDYADDEDAKQ